MKTQGIRIGKTSLWLVYETLVFYKKGKLEESNSFLCYFNFLLPLQIPYGELLLDENDIPKIFKDENEAVVYASTYLKKRFEEKYKNL